ncbi:MAG: AAA family ATPase [Vulcanimicrobiota bacterium]
MITRLKVSGFKNLFPVEACFGPLTGIAGLNGVGKSNLFDALAFLKLLSSHSLMEAASQVRGGDQGLANLFTQKLSSRIDLDLDFLVPKSGIDDFGQPASASATFLNYQLSLGLVNSPYPRLELVSEQLTQIRKREAADKLKFAGRDWTESVLQTSSRSAPFISTDTNAGLIFRHQDQAAKKGGGNKWQFPSNTLTRTVLSSAQNAQESPTLVLARQCLMNIRFLQLEPSALRLPDSFSSDNQLTSGGAHLPATLEYLSQKDPDCFFVALANRLSTLVDNVASVRVERDEARKSLIVFLETQAGESFPASCLSDGTLRFLALATLEKDPRVLGSFCLEEPENGIHPERLTAILKMLRAHATDPSYSSDDYNPLRQVIFSTHSPALVEQMFPEEILFAVNDSAEWLGANRLSLIPIEGGWRKGRTVNPGDLMSYLNGTKWIDLQELSADYAPSTVMHWVQGKLFDQ